MWRSLLVVLICCALSSLSFSQSYDASLPKLGNVTYKCNYIGFVQPAFFNKESATNYDFNFLTTTWSIKEVMRPTASSLYKKTFPQANIVHLKANNEEEFYNVKNGACYSYGKIIESRNSRKPLIVKHYPYDMHYSTVIRVGNRYTNNYRTEIKLAKRDLLYTNLNTIREDSIKVEITTKENVQATFEGTIELSDKKRKARRYEAQVTNTISTYIKKAGESWRPSNIAFSALPVEIINLYKAKAYTHVFFLNPDFVGPIMSYDFIDGEIKNISFQENEVSPLSINFSYDEGEIIAWPNPTVGPITFEIFNYPYDNYELKVYNIVGKKILTRSFTPADGRSLDADLSSLKKGIYIYSLFDGKGRNLLTKRISITSI
jgi:hypothetical protein